MALFSSICLIAFVNLGFWQLERADEKTELLKVHAQQRNQPPLSATELLRRAAAVDGLPVELVGRFSGIPALLRDNVVLEGRVGFEVLEIFNDSATNQMFLINRGFVPMAANRQIKPTIPPVSEGDMSLFGHVYVSTAVDERFTPGELMDDLRIVQSTEPRILENLVAVALYPHLIRLEADAAFALPRRWIVTTVSSDKHMGYAIQWFLMALAVLIAFGYFTFKSPADEA